MTKSQQDAERGTVTYYYVQQGAPRYGPQGGQQGGYGTVNSTTNSQFPGQQAGFSLDLTWSPRNWFVSATFMPGGGPDTIGEAQTLDPSWELSGWAPPLDKTLAPTMSLLNLDPTGTLNAKSVPAYIPTEISLATLAFSSDGVQFRALIKSLNVRSMADVSVDDTAATESSSSCVKGSKS